ncbi:MAG: GrpB family protein [Spirochaetales bacterium]|nr:GrpB family protein [Spirochaetales bacterium]
MEGDKGNSLYFLHVRTLRIRTIMTKEELGILYPISICDHNKEWRSHYLKEEKLLNKLFPFNLAIEHIGSTAVPGLKSKPTIDILCEKPEDLTNSEIIDIFSGNGYLHMEEQSNHLMFVKGYTPSGLEKISFHIHMGSREQSWLWDRIYFRDYLIKNNSFKEEYEKLKTTLAVRHKHDREAYTREKAELIMKITEEGKKFFTGNMQK